MTQIRQVPTWDISPRVVVDPYKLEFMSQHYKGRLRPRAAYALGLIFLWARLSARVPRLVNFI